MERLLQSYNNDALMREITLASLRKDLKRGRGRRNVEEMYKHMGGTLKRPKWHDTSHGMMLEDAYTRTACILFPLHSEPICVWPFGKRTKLDLTFAKPFKVPKLNKDILQHVAKHLDGFDLLTCRMVNRRWKRMVDNPSVWKNKLQVPPALKVTSWDSKPAFRQFILYTLHNITSTKLVGLFLEHPPFFAHFFNCSLMNTTTHQYRLIPEPFRLAVYDRKRRYWIPYDSDVIKSDASRFFKYAEFLERFRKLLKGE